MGSNHGGRQAAPAAQEAPQLGAQADAIRALDSAALSLKAHRGTTVVAL